MLISHETCISRAQGALVGAAVGDSMGAPCEGMSAGEIRERFGELKGFVEDSRGGTDDTDFTLFNAYMLVVHGTSISTAEVEQEWRDKLLSGHHYYRAGGFSDVLATNNLQEGMHAPDSGRFNHQMWSDGVAMSVSSAGVVTPGSPRRAAEISDTLGAVSNGRDGLYTAQAVAAAISVAMTGADISSMLVAAREVVPLDSWTNRAITTAIEIGSRGLSGADLTRAIDQELILHWWPWADLATEAVPVAFAFFAAYGEDFRRAVPAAIAIGRDADTIGAIVGSLCGAHLGIEGIPLEWRDRVTVSRGQSIGFVADRSIVDIGRELGDLAWREWEVRGA